MKKSLSLLLAITLILSMGAASFAQISDIKTHWANQEISYLVEKGVLNGYPDGTFKPDNPMTKVEFYKVINQLLNFEKTVEVTYLDVHPRDWYYEDVGRALAAGYISPATFLAPNENISRQEVARILGFAYNLNEESDAANLFSDSELILPETKGYIGALLENGLLQGYPDETFRPTANITRAEVVKLIYNVLRKLNDLPIKGSVDKSELKETIKDAENLSKSKYTSTTWKNLESTLETAIDVYGNEDATQEEIDKTLNDLLDAIDDLKKISTSSDRDTSDSSDSRYTLTKGTNKITTPVIIRKVTVSGDVTIDYTHSGFLDFPVGLTINGNLTVIAPKATVNNYATVTGEIIIKDVASTTWYEYADGNTLIIEDENGLVLNIIGDIAGITVSESASGGLVITVAEGSIISFFEINAPVTIICPRPIEVTISPGVEVLAKTDKDTTGTTVRGTGDQVVLNPKLVAVSSISVSPTTMNLAVGGVTGTILATVSPENATNKNVTWTTSNAGVATVSNGVVTPVAAGTAIVTATAGEKTATCTVMVVEIIKSTDATLNNLEVNGTSVTGFQADTLTYNIELADGTTTVPTIVATVSDTGKANAVVTPALSLPGATIVVVTAEDRTTTKTYTINFTIADTTPPTGYTVVIVQDFINRESQTAFSFSILGAEVGASYNYSIDDIEGIGSITGNGTIASISDSITGIDVSDLSDGILTLTVSLIDEKGNKGTDATDTVLKDIIAPEIDYTKFLVEDNISPIMDKIYGVKGAIGESGAIVKAYLWTDTNMNTMIDDGEFGPAIILGDSLADGSVVASSIGDLASGTYRYIITATDLASNESIADEASGITIMLINCPDMIGTVTISGIEKVGQTLTADISDLSNVGTPTYKWMRNAAEIVGATSSTYTLREADINTTISVEVTADNISGRGSVTSAATGLIGKGDQSPPPAPTVNYFDKDYVTLKTNDSYEYSKDGVNWQEGGYFGDLTEGASYTFYARVKETETHLASLASPGTTVTTTMQLGKVAKPIWNSNSIEWDAVPNASHYIVYIYKEGKPAVVGGEYIYSGTSCPITSFSSKIATEGPGIYTATVTALAPLGNVYSNGLESEPSNPYEQM